MELFTEEERKLVECYIAYAADADESFKKEIEEFNDNDLILLLYKVVKQEKKVIKNNLKQDIKNKLVNFIHRNNIIFLEMNSFYDFTWKAGKDNCKQLIKGIKKFCRNVNDETADILMKELCLAYDFTYNSCEGSKKINSNFEKIGTKDWKIFVADQEFNNMLNDYVKLIDIKYNKKNKSKIKRNITKS